MNRTRQRITIFVAGLLVMAGIAIWPASLLRAIRRAADEKRVTANAQLLGRALSEYRIRTGKLPEELDELFSDEGAMIGVIPNYLQAVTNHFVVVYTPVSNAQVSTVILTVSDSRYTAVVTGNFRVTVAKNSSRH